MATRIGINGFGRIGRQSLRAMLERHPQDLEVVAVNDLTDSATNAHLFRFDSTYGRFNDNLDYTEEPLVSSDFRGDDHSAIVDGLSTQALGDHLVKALAWYDNEWGYSCRVADLTQFIAQRL